MNRLSISKTHGTCMTFFTTLILATGLLSNDRVYGQCQGFEVTITAPSSATVCIGDNITAVSQVIGGTPPYTYSWMTGGTGPTETVVAAPTSNTFSVTVVDANGCAAISNTIYVKPVYTHSELEFGFGNLCIGQGGMQLEIEESYGASFLWSTGETTDRIWVTESGYYSVTLTDPNGCQISFDTNLIFIPPPVAEIEGPVNLCNGQLGTLDVLGGPFYLFDWASGEDTPSISIDGPGEYQVTVTDFQFCTDEASIEIVPFPTPPPILNVPSFLCPHSAGTAELVNVQDYVAFNWSNGESSHAIPVFPGDTYAVTVTEADGCTEVGSISIAEYPVFSPFITGEAEICEGQQSVELTALPPFESYLWSTTETTQSISVSAANDYFLTVTDINGCTSEGIFVISPNEIPQPSIQSSGTCSGEPMELAVESGPFTSYNWSNGDTSSMIDVGQPGSYAVTVTNESGCTGSATVEINLSNGPTASINYSPSPRTESAQITASGGNFYDWSNGDTTAAITVTTNGSYTVTVTDWAGCTATAEEEVTIPDIPQASITGPPELCTGALATLTASDGFVQYLWSGGETTADISISQPGTYSVTVTDDHGCTATAIQSVANTPNPEPEISGPIGICQGSTVILGLNQPFPQMTWSTGSEQSSIEVSHPGVYSIIVTDENGCTGTGQWELSNFELPTVDITGPLSICHGSTTVYSVTDNFAQIIWNTGETAASINASLPGVYGVTVTDTNGCTSDDTQTLETGTSLSPVITISSTSCQGTINLDAGGGYDGYLWSDGSSDPIVTVNTDGVFYVTVSDGMGCSGEDDITVVIPTAPEVDIDGPSIICEGTSATLTADSGFSIYNWSNGETTANIDVSQDGIYTVTATDTNGCTAEASLLFGTSPTPELNITGPASFCTGDQVQLMASGNFFGVVWSTGESTTDIYVDQPGSYSVLATDVNGCTTEALYELTVNGNLSPNIMASDFSCDGWAVLDAQGGYNDYLWSNGETGSAITVHADGTYFVTVGDGNGCVGMDSLSVNLLTAPIVELFGDPFICAGNSTEYSVPDNFTQILWSTGETAPSIMASSPGNYSVTVADANGCTASDEQFLEVFDFLEPNITTSYTNCDGTATLDAGAGYDGYLWSDGSVDPTMTISSNGAYEVTVSGTNGCTGTAEIEVFIPDLPVINISGALTLCEGEHATLAVPGTFEQYLWNTGENTPSIVVSQGGTYSVTVSDAYGCTATDTWTLEQLQTDFTVVNAEACSPQDTGTVEVLLTNLFGCDSVIIINTTLAPGAVTEVELSACAGEFTEFNGIPIAAGMTQQFIYNAINGCDSMVTVTVNALPSVTFDLTTEASCWNTMNGAIQVEPQSGTAPYQYTLNNGSLQPSSVFVDLPSGPFNVLVSDANGCVSEQMVNIGQLQPTEIEVDAPDLTCDDPTVYLQPVVVAGTLGNIHWLWDDGSTQPWLLVEQPGQFTLQVDDGCEIQELSVQVSWAETTMDQNLFYIPNSFSPNHDGINDEFKVYPSQDLVVRSLEFKVFDRWGDMVFGTADVNEGWDGMHRQVQKQPGVYAWYVKAEAELCNGQEVHFYQEGGVTIIR